MWKTITGGKIWHGEIKNKAKDGTLYWVKTTIVPFFDQNDQIDSYVSIRTDITARKNTEEKLRNVIASLQKSNSHIDYLNKIDKMKEEFLCMITHELKTPLTPIIAWAEALQTPELLGSLSIDQSHAVDEIHFSAIRLKKLIGDLFDARRLETNKVSFSFSDFDVQEMISNIIEGYRFVAVSKKIKITDLTTEKILLYSDKARIEQVLGNLLNNAIDFVPENTGIIEIIAKNDNDTVLFSIKDNGTGIEPDQQKKLFQKFYQIDTSITREHGGAGLGLSICKEIIERLGGKIGVKSESFVGSEFFFNLPKNGIIKQKIKNST
jgi:signal transduction histidine kinase